jgi:uncharacterized protein (DUF433 family)
MKADRFVEESPGVGGGYPQVRGTRTPVRVIVNLFRQTNDLERTAALLPHLTVAEIQGALDYYAKRPGRVDEDIERNARAWAERQARGWPA